MRACIDFNNSGFALYNFQIASGTHRINSHIEIAKELESKMMAQRNPATTPVISNHVLVPVFILL